MSDGSPIHELFKRVRRPTVKHEHYFAIYDELFAPYRGKDITFVEIGILGGGSLEAWREYFGPGSRIIGIDLNPALKQELEKEGYQIFIGDQADPEFWRRFYAEVGDIDIILDDGGHTNHQMWTTVKQALPHVRDGGLIIVEDTHAAYKASFGNPSRSSLVRRLSSVINEIHYRSSEITAEDRALRRSRDARLLHGLPVSSRVHSVRFFESVIALAIDGRKCAPSSRVCYGSAEALPNAEQPADFRTHGIRDALLHRVRGRVRRLIARARSSV